MLIKFGSTQFTRTCVHVYGWAMIIVLYVVFVMYSFENDGEIIVIYCPAIIRYYSNGIISRKSYYINGKLHNEHGPAVMMYYGNGTLLGVEYWCTGELRDGYGSDGMVFRSDGSAALPLC